MFVPRDRSGVDHAPTVAHAMSNEHRFRDGTFALLVAHVSSEEQQLRGRAHEMFPVRAVVVPAERVTESHNELFTEFVDPDPRGCRVVGFVVQGDVLERDLGPGVAESAKAVQGAVVQLLEDPGAERSVHLGSLDARQLGHL